MPSPINSPLFTVAAKAFRDEALRQFQRTEFGRLLHQTKQSMRQSSKRREPASQLRWAQTFTAPGFNAGKILQQLRGSDFGQLAREVYKYSRGGGSMGRFVNQFLQSLGPAGQLLQAVADSAGGGGQAALNAAMKLIRFMGGEVLPPDGASLADVQRGLAAAAEYQRRHGQVMPPHQEPDPSGRGRLPFDGKTVTRGGVRKARLPWNDDGTRYKNLPVDHPIVTGNFVNVRSSNVHSFGYDIEHRYLYIRFLDRLPGGERVGEGPLYRYSTVEPQMALGLYNLSRRGGSVGRWVWDQLRERGTISGHKKPYELVGITQGYVPRMASLTRRGEEFVERSVHVGGGRWLRSQLAPQLVRPLRPVNRGEPNTGRP